jgi:hypothetical protein
MKQHEKRNKQVMKMSLLENKLISAYTEILLLQAILGDSV